MEAATFPEYVNSFFFMLCGLLGISFNAALLWQKTKVIQLIGELEDIFDKRRTFSLALITFNIIFFWSLPFFDLKKKINSRKTIYFPFI